MPRPVRPRVNFNDDNYLGKYPASEKIRHRPVDVEKHREFIKGIISIPPERR